MNVLGFNEKFESDSNDAWGSSFISLNVKFFY